MRVNGRVKAESERDGGCRSVGREDEAERLEMSCFWLGGSRCEKRIISAEIKRTTCCLYPLSVKYFKPP